MGRAAFLPFGNLMVLFPAASGGVFLKLIRGVILLFNQRPCLLFSGLNENGAAH